MNIRTFVVLSSLEDRDTITVQRKAKDNEQQIIQRKPV
jgi:hypothetical protein